MQCELAKRMNSKLSFSPGMLSFKYELADFAELIERSEVVFLSLKEFNSLLKTLSLCGAPPHDPASPVRAYKKALPKKHYSLDSIKREDYERGAEVLLNIGAKIVCVTLAEKGCYVADSTGESHMIDACPTKDVEDTTGAGDAFAAGFLFELIHEKGIYESGKTGNLVASFCIREYGCRKGLPFKLS